MSTWLHRHDDIEDAAKRGKVDTGTKRTDWMTAGELRLLRVLSLEHVADAVEQLHVALLGVRLDGRDESPGHGACGLGRNGGVGPESSVSI